MHPVTLTPAPTSGTLHYESTDISAASISKISYQLVYQELFEVNFLIPLITLSSNPANVAVHGANAVKINAYQQQKFVTAPLRFCGVAVNGIDIRLCLDHQIHTTEPSSMFDATHNTRFCIEFATRPSPETTCGTFTSDTTTCGVNCTLHFQTSNTTPRSVTSIPTVLSTHLRRNVFSPCMDHWI